MLQQRNYLRGDSWLNYFPSLARASCRGRNVPADRFGVIGFRCVMEERSLGTLRGGSWHDDQHFARGDFRYYDHPYARNSFIGFRVVREL